MSSAPSPTSFSAAGRFFASWVMGAHRYRRLALFLAAVLTAASAFWSVTALEIDTNTADMISRELPYRQDYIAYKEAFPQFSDTIVVVLDAATPDLADDAAQRLASNLAAMDLFDEIFYPRGDPFFRRAGFLYLSLDELEDFSTRIAAAAPLLAQLVASPTLATFFETLAEATRDNIGNGNGETMTQLVPLYRALTRAAEAAAENRRHWFSWQNILDGGVIEEINDAADTRRFIILRPRLDFATLSPAALAIGAVDQTAANLDLDLAHGIRLRLTGSAVLEHEELQSVATGMGIAGVVSLSLVALLLVWCLRHWQLVGAALVTLLAGLLWTAGFATWAVGHLNLISVAFAVLFVGLGIDFGIQFTLRYREERQKGVAHDPALEAAGSSTGPSIAVAATAAAIGFFAFIPTDYLGLAELGLIAGGGMIIAVIATLTLLPALLASLPVLTSPAPHAVEKEAASSPRFRTRTARLVTAGLVLTGIAAGFAVPHSRFDVDPMNLRDPSSEGVATARELMAAADSAYYTIAVLAADKQAATQLATALTALPEVADVSFLDNYVPDNQDLKNDIIGEMGFFLAPVFQKAAVKPNTGTTSSPDLPSNAPRAAMADLIAALEARRASGANGEKDAAERLQKALLTLQAAPEARLAALETMVFSPLAGRLALLREGLEATPFGAGDLPAAMRDRLVSEDGRLLLTVEPAADLRDRAAMERFVAAVTAVVPHATDTPVILIRSGETILHAFRTAGIIAGLGIVLLLALVLRRGVDVVLVIAPLLLAALLTAASTVILGITFNFANIIAIPLLFSLGVAFGIHLILRFREEGRIETLIASSTPRAVLFSALTTMASFGSLSLSNHPGTASMGYLLALSLSWALVTTLILLPALLVLLPASRARS